MTAAQPKSPRTAGFTPSPVEALAHQLPATLAQHRIASTNQLHVLLRPDRSRQSVSERLNNLLGKRLADVVVLPSPTTPGSGTSHRRDPPHSGLTRTARSSAVSDHLSNGRLIQDPAHPHNHADAPDVRRRCPPPRRRTRHLDWTPEVSHPLSDGEDHHGRGDALRTPRGRRDRGTRPFRPGIRTSARRPGSTPPRATCQALRRRPTSTACPRWSPGPR